MEKRKIIIDTDPGIDDAFAITAAFRYDGFEVLGLTTVAGNKLIDVVTANGSKLTKLNHVNSLVYKGATQTIAQMEQKASAANVENADEVHGADGLGGVYLPIDESNISDIHAVDFILDTIKKYPNEVEIIAIGPLTNLALAIRKDKETMKKVKAIWSMGGGVLKGNMTPVAEFNYWYDPESVAITFRIGNTVPIHMVGLNMTGKSGFHKEELNLLEDCGEIGKTLLSMVKKYGEDFETEDVNCVIHDLACVMYAIRPDICPKESIYHANLQIPEDGLCKGETIVDLIDSWKLEKNAYVPMDINRDEYVKEFFKVTFNREL